MFQRIQLDLSGYTRFAHDPANRVLTTTFPPPASFPSGNRTVSLTYDAAGQLLTATAPDTGVVVHTYDTSLLATSTWTGTIAGSVERTYDALDRLATQSVNGGQSVPFTYDDGGFLTGAGALTLGRTPQGGLLSNTALGVVGDTSTYDGNEKVLTYQATAGVTVLLDQQYTRDEFGRVSQKIERLDGTTTTFAYTYDATGQLKQVTQDGSLVTTYTYDPNGNREQQDRPGGVVTGVYDAQDRLLSWGNATYAYTANGELSSKTVGSQTTAYDYDVLGNLLAVTLPDTTQIDYIVDGENRRIGKSINGMLVQGFLYQDALNPVAELDGSGNVVARFVYGSKEQVPDYMEKGGVIYRLISDQLGSVRLVVDTTTGGIVQRIDYDEFGQILVDTNPDFQPFGFAGGLYDQDTKLTRFGARDYDAEVGKWTAKDPIRFEGKDTNLYGYVFNDPVNLIDPEGQTFIIGVDAPSALIGALFGSTSTVAYNIAYSLRTGCEIDYTQLAYDAVAAAGLGAVLGGHLHLKAIFLSPAALARIDRIAEALAALHVGGVLGFNLGVVRPGSECRSTEP